MIAPVLDVAGASLIGVGVLLILLAVVGLNRFRDAVTRAHAATKPQMLGLALMLAGLALALRSWEVVAIGIVAVFTQGLAASAAAHITSRAAFRNRMMKLDELYVDELSARIAELGDPDEDDDGFVDE